MLNRFYAFYHTSAKMVYTFGNGPSFVMQRVMCALNHLISRARARERSFRFLWPRQTRTHF